MYYKKGEASKVYCSLCPHYCSISENKAGKCRVRKNIEGTLYTLNYGKITSYAYDPIEKKPLYHFYPGSNIFSIGSFGCNLACEFCQNWEIVNKETLTMEIEDQDMLTLSTAKHSIGIAYTYNEPTIWFEYVRHLLDVIKDKNLKNILITNGYINEEPLRQLLPYIDAMNIDLKSINDSFYNNICKGSLEPVLKTIEISSKVTHIEVTTLVIDGENSSLEEIDSLSQKIASINKSIPLHLSRYFPAYKMKRQPTNFNTLMEARNIARKHLDYVYIGNVWGVDNNTYCPNCYTKIVDRYNGGKVLGVERGKCIKCGYKINIIY
ncbi:AmmeMemoRadiSam system radical SAM enzyme [Tissierella sp. MSJ-40]|uniref:AmmeMemoRadiSam system radical SAM enzyme n=2 Tax=Tissierella simiarum TaxID=2841534 RepID=A0ABS6E482_9FIRM|nr:AmmeMemoRadiSam system radical SAM enzyme [Tissierella simiarum]MBU5437064.1 AmmeMemoRadiSam system radical SAM enzyme [Tissierella simiarum]